MSEHRATRAAQRPLRRALPVVAVVAAALLAGCGKQQAVDHEVTAAAILPVAQLHIVLQKATPGSRTGEEIYKAVCTTCHGAGVLGAPTTGDADQWAPRIAKGLDALVASVHDGLGAMPPKGGAADLTDAELVRATAYLANTAGAGFTEPPVEQ
ncbi:cytochrome c5 family protein [Pseudothauera nasutitermitis]|uniref:Cytochrome c5 family protein n=1 Tax=Pseudothauera nasutitermitis TaxID=2565930 RepID=A0A4S4AXJ1_9RHOO|nr:c-type cytochrome [Pseudothauera nasutitermitis]THF64640.1 cytochrome c5 family protein [Pseudothauera nasutitermitis]